MIKLKFVSSTRLECKHCTCKQLITHGTHVVLFFSQHGLFQANLKTHQYKYFISLQGKHEVRMC